jgi:hypothetical protein
MENRLAMTAHVLPMRNQVKLVLVPKTPILFGKFSENLLRHFGGPL